MILCEDNKIKIKGPVTINNVIVLKEEVISLFVDSSHLVVDLENILEVDSSVVSMLLEWLRESNRRKCRLHFVNVPENITSLIQLYGVSEFLPLGLNNKLTD